MMINMFDSNMTGTIDIQEFGKLFTFVNEKKGMFENFDRNKEGTLGQDEFLQALQSMGYRLKQHIEIKIIRYSPQVYTNVCPKSCCEI